MLEQALAQQHGKVRVAYLVNGREPENEKSESKDKGANEVVSPGESGLVDCCHLQSEMPVAFGG